MAALNKGEKKENSAKGKQNILNDDRKFNNTQSFKLQWNNYIIWYTDYVLISI
jgi:hypothetical protein